MQALVFRTCGVAQYSVNHGATWLAVLMLELLQSAAIWLVLIDSAGLPKAELIGQPERSGGGEVGEGGGAEGLISPDPSSPSGRGGPTGTGNTGKSDCP
jgi:hypothetical protein